MLEKIRESVRQLGAAHIGLAPMQQTRSRVSEPIPFGAGKLIGEDSGYFVWQPIAEKDWRNLSDEDRGWILIERGRRWLERNANQAAPIDFARDSEGNLLFDEELATIKRALCAAKLWLETNPIKSRAAVTAVSVGLHSATGVPAIPEGAELLLLIYAYYFCGSSSEV